MPDRPGPPPPSAAPPPPLAEVSPPSGTPSAAPPPPSAAPSAAPLPSAAPSPAAASPPSASAAPPPAPTALSPAPAAAAIASGFAPVASPSARVGAAYDSIAAAYDGLVSEDAWMRERLWAHHLRAFPPGGRVLDVACGTGLDTLHLAARGRRLTGVDVSPGMLAALRQKAAEQGLGEQVETRTGDAGSLAGAWDLASFDGILSSFAGLNTTDLGAFAAAAARLVRPHGRVVIHLLAPAGIWDRLRLAAAGRPAAALRLGARRELTVTIAGNAVTHHLLPAGDLYDGYFRDAFQLRGWYGLGWLWPRHLGARLGPRTARALGRLDAALGRCDPWRRFARFLVLDLERRAPPAS